MKTIFKILILVACLFVAMSSCRAVAENVLTNEQDGECLYLISGFDDAASNTDVLFTLGFDKLQKKIFVAQIPRDTYFNFGSGQNKINQLYASLRARGMDSFSAMKKTADEIAGLFGTSFDGFIGLTTEAFRVIVDSLGGIDIKLNSDIQMDFEGESPFVLNAGINHIDGKTAEKLVRYRAGYARGDLARIDIQKIFLNALLSKLSSGITLPQILSVASAINDKIVTDINIVEIADFIIGNVSLLKGAESSYVTLPGEAIQDRYGISYYVINRKSGIEISKRYMFSKSEFDKERRLLREDDVGFVNIYEDDSILPREYNSSNVSQIRI